MRRRPNQPVTGYRSPYLNQRPRKQKGDGIIAGLGCLGVSLVILANVAWWGFVVWAIYKIVMWITAQEV